MKGKVIFDPKMKESSVTSAFLSELATFSGFEVKEGTSVELERAGDTAFFVGDSQSFMETAGSFITEVNHVSISDLLSLPLQKDIIDEDQYSEEVASAGGRGDELKLIRTAKRIGNLVKYVRPQAFSSATDALFSECMKKYERGD
mgnify:CR=1 FL=1